MTPQQTKECVRKILNDQLKTLELFHRAGDYSGVLRGKTGYVWKEDLQRLASGNPDNWRNNLTEMS